ncbi:MAG: IPT/TIG domain-containing protein [Acidobacteriota bacterium]|nr:IPT/TIG domain-containing protein [Acidobacteriota bacterium]
MRTLVAILVLSVGTSLSAQNVRFDPPNPTSRTPIIAHVVGDFSPCTPTALQNGMRLSIYLHNCSLPLGGPIVDLQVDLGVLPAGVYDVSVGFAPPAILIGLGRGTLVVQDAAPPFRLTPNVAALGGTQVTLTGPMFGPNPMVRFGDVVATVISESPNSVTVIAPPHAPGVVDVTVYALQATASFYYAPNDKTPDPAFYEPVFFPIAFAGPGALGSQWTTQITLRNENDYPVPILPMSAFNLGCVFECDSLVPKHSTRTTGINTPNGFFGYVPRQASPAVHFDTLIKDLSHQSEALGTEIPVVREKDFFARPVELLNVPTDPRFRVALRVYGTSAALAIQPLNSDENLVSSAVFPAGNPPFTLISDLVAAYPQLAGKGAVRITLSPFVVGNPALWALVSVTNNETQHVTTISPQ